jgi:ketosteroid isomerase-like protein
MSEDAHTSTDRSKLDALERVLDGFNRHDLEAIMSYFVEDCVFESSRGPDPWGRRVEGREAVRDAFRARFTGLPDVSYEGHGDFVTGDRGASEWTLRGITVDGQRLEVRGCDLWTFRGDRIVRKDSYWKLVQQ